MKTKKIQRPIDQVYVAEISPLVQAIKQICRTHNICMLAAFSVPMTQNAGVIMLDMETSKDGTVPTEFLEAYQLIEGRRAPEPPIAPAG